MKRPVAPLLFMKPPTAVIGPDEPIIYPRSDKELEVHFEGELVAVIGRRARRLSKSHALNAVFGYTCGNDLSERVIQRIEMGMGHLLIGKAYDTFCPLGPVIATDLDPRDLLLETRVNSELTAIGTHVRLALLGRRSCELHQPGRDAAARRRDNDRYAIRDRSD